MCRNKEKMRSTGNAPGSKSCDFETVAEPAAFGVRPAPARRVHTCTYRELWCRQSVDTIRLLLKVLRTVVIARCKATAR